ncbi:MAG: TIGR00730 family Rossman fold protein [Alphaproteobacteria bacterium]|nr:TIGR00730 family Rossman fold protein [Alphaproteobacteria bacterium]
MPNSFQSVQFSLCVFCGSRMGIDADFGQAARNLGEVLARNKWRLVYGAGDVGLMGEVARATQALGGETFGVIPEHLMSLEAGKHDLSHFVITQTMHERKKVMFMNSNAMVILPGGAGTLDEFFEVVTWRHLGLHSKPIYLLNINGYWDVLLTMLDQMIEQGFADSNFCDHISVVNTVTALEQALSDYLARRKPARV